MVTFKLVIEESTTSEE